MIKLQRLLESTLGEISLERGDAEGFESTSIELIRKYGKGLIPDEILKSSQALKKRFTANLQKSLLKKAVVVKNNIAVIKISTSTSASFVLFDFNNTMQDACIGVISGFTFSNSIYGATLFKVDWSFVIEEERGKGYASTLYDAVWAEYDGIISDTKLYKGSLKLWKNHIIKQAKVTVAVIGVDRHDFDNSFVCVPFSEGNFANRKYINDGVYSLMAFKNTVPAKLSKFLKSISNTDYVSGTLEIMYCAYSTIDSKDFTLDPKKPKNKVTIIDLIEKSKNGFDKTFIANLIGTKNQVRPMSQYFRKTDFSKVKQLVLMLDGSVILITLNGKNLKYDIY